MAAKTEVAALTQNEVMDLAEKKTTFQEALQLLANQGYDPLNDEIDQLEGIPVLKEKDDLIGIPFLIASWEFHEGEMGEFVSMLVFTQDDKRFIVNDGSTGICKQLRELTERREEVGLPNTQTGRMVRFGLRRSDYTYTDEAGKKIPASTHYLDA